MRGGKVLLVCLLAVALLTGCTMTVDPNLQLQSSSQPSEAVVAPPEASEHEHEMEMAELGEVNFPVSCTPEAQAEFNHAMALLHSFEYPAAIDSFTTVSELDPSCAMAHWGIAMSLVEPLWQAAAGQDLVDGWAAVEQAQAAGAQTPREQAYIDAIAAFYQDGETVDHLTRSLAYTEAMAQLVQDYPEDTEGQIFYTLALLATAQPTDKSYANQLKAVGLLEQVFAAQPNHPGAAHYLIHSNDYPALAEHGLDAALRYASIAPAAPHALHMPSHIFTRLGYWQESIDTNIASANAGKAALAASQPPGTSSSTVLHAMDYQMYAYLQLGQDEAAQALLDEVNTLEQIDPEDPLGSAYALAAIPARYALERGQWAEASAVTLPPVAFAWESFPQAEAINAFARGLGAARSGDVAAAQQEIERLAVLSEAMVALNLGYWAGQAEIQSTAIAAWAALAEGNLEEALALMRQAVEMEAATEKNPVTPGPLVPAQELLGEMLLELDQPAEALAAFAVSHEVEPNRFRGLYGAARAAELAGDLEKARTYYEQLVALGATVDSERPEMAAAKAFLAQE
jgi:tetratricopeptide (TPR) repeat protein